MTASSTARSCTRISQTYVHAIRLVSPYSWLHGPCARMSLQTVQRLIAYLRHSAPNPPPAVWGKTFKNRVSPLRRYRSWQTSVAGFRMSITRTAVAYQTVASTAPHETHEEWPPSLPYKLMHKRQSERLVGSEQTKQKMMAHIHRRPKIWNDAASSHLDAGIRLRLSCIPTSSSRYGTAVRSRALVRRQEALGAYCRTLTYWLCHRWILGSLWK